MGSGIAVLADPVFDAEDARVEIVERAAPGQPVASLVRGPDAIYPRKFQRLPGTREESRRIVESAAEMDVFTVLDTDANRDLVLDGQLDEFRILHFATHGVLDIEEPALSGLVLSGVTGTGLPRSRFLLTQDIVSLDLKADLVVLSGCDTGIGRAVRAEGLLSLSRAFFYAGAEQVVSTLWQVPDRATAELMGHFYREMLQNQKPVATALRLAQLAVMNDRRWSRPYYWAAFTLQGDWAQANSQMASR